jgi:shikimate kinase
MFLSAFKGEFLEADKATGLIGGVVASVTVQLRPRALRRGCFFAGVCGLDRGRLARSEVAVTLLLASA